MFYLFYGRVEIEFLEEACIVKPSRRPSVGSLMVREQETFPLFEINSFPSSLCLRIHDCSGCYGGADPSLHRGPHPQAMHSVARGGGPRAGGGGGIRREEMEERGGGGLLSREERPDHYSTSDTQDTLRTRPSLLAH